jgi:hypothetical protein
MKFVGDRSGIHWLLASAVGTCAMVGTLYFSVIAPVVLLGPVVALAIFPKNPRLGFLVWLLSVAAVPCWIGAGAGGIFIPATLIASLVAITCLLTGVKWTPSKADLCVVALLVFAALGTFFGSSTGTSSMSAFSSIFTLWIPGYLVGRFVCEKAGISFVQAAVGVTFGAVGLMALIEKLLSWHPFARQVGMNSLAEIWAPIQTRGGEDRSEWVFGHSIALGGSLAVSIPFLLSSSLKTRNKLLLLALILGGVAMTLSRGAMLAAGLTLVLSLITAKNLQAGQRFLLFVAAAVLACFTLISFAAVSDEAGTEVTHSSSYRVSLFIRLIGSLAPFGRASSYMADATGSGQYGIYGSIDNAFMAIGLGFGWVPMLIVAVPFVAMGIRFLRGRASFAEVALIGQLPVITTVAMITQYQVMVWMVAGIAATLARAASRATEGQPTKPKQEAAGRVTPALSS